MERREFIKKLGFGAAAVGTAGLVDACKGKKVKVEGPVVQKEFLGDNIGLLGYGCMRWPMIKDENGNKFPDQEAVNEMVDLALSRGVNYYDSSPVYMSGQSEIAAARALVRHPRENYYIATKLSVFKEPTREKCIEMYRKSLEIYQTDYIDYYLLHNVRGHDNFKTRFVDNGIWDFLMQEKAAGHIRHLGISTHSTKSGFDELMALYEQYHWDFVQIQMNYKDWNHATKSDLNASYCFEELSKRNIPVIVMEPLLGGQLAKLPEEAVKLLKSIEPDKSAASWALRFCASFPNVVTVLSGMNCMEHLEDNLETFSNFKPLSEPDFSLLERIATILSEFPLINCTGCSYCMPCPYGIDIPGIFKFYNNRVRSSSFSLNAEQKGYERERKRFLLAYNESVESLAQADHCIGCGKCVKACPQNIKIPREIHRIDNYIEQLKRGGIEK